jgi:hypothetical protein
MSPLPLKLCRELIRLQFGKRDIRRAVHLGFMTAYWTAELERQLREAQARLEGGSR